jgi:cell fate regulator YaaT (PSP1 superfamily)
MDAMEKKNSIVGIRFNKVGKIYHFDAGDIEDLKIGDPVIVETARGWQLGFIAQKLGIPEGPGSGTIKKIERRATPLDLMLRQTWQAKEGDVMQVCRDRVNQLNLSGIKIVATEYSFDGTRLTITYCSDTEEKVELKSLRQDMQKKFSPAQVELRQVGPRDEAKSLCGMGACGLESRCCSSFLTEFSSISIRMAKEQGISLTPSEITGMCGRLRCCLIYEYETYTEYRQQLPKRNKIVITTMGEGKVVDINVLAQTIVVEFPETGIRVLNKEDIKSIKD